MGETLSLLKDGTHGTHKNVDDGYYLLSAKNIKNGKVLMFDDDRKISKDEYSLIHRNFVLKDKDVLITIVGSIGQSALYRLKEPVTFQRSVAYLRPKLFSSEYLYWIINTPMFKKKLQASQTLSAQPGIYLSDLSSITINYTTNFKEENKIVQLLNFINKTIELHQRKLENLKLLKLGLIQNLFPANGKLRPMINITNNVENWQQLKLFDVLEIPIKERLENPALNKLITVGLNLTGIRVGSARETLDIGATTYYVRRKGQLIYGKQNFFNGSMAIIDDKYDGYATSIDVPALNINNNKVDSKFLYYYISRPCYYKRTEAQAIGTGSKRIHEKTLLSFEIYLPPLATQKKIAKLINNIEKYIAKQNLLLNNYINIKNKYLQSLFI